MPSPQPRFAELASAAAGCLAWLREVGGLSDDDLLDTQRQLAESQRVLATAAAAMAAEVQHRSRRELGYDGLAQKRGMRTAEALVQAVTGAPSSTARRLVRVGTLAKAGADSEPWLADALAAFRVGAISADAVDAIRSGLGRPGDSVPPDALAGAARALTRMASSVTVERLAALARERRDDLDA